jgi:uncharacterized protein (TIGR02001 family)
MKLPLISFLLLPFHLAVAQTPSASKSEAAKIYGEATFLSNLVKFGLSESRKDPSFQGGFGYKFGPSRIGLWGSTVSFENSDESLNLRLIAEYKMEFTPNFWALPKLSLNRFYKSGDKNGLLLNVDFSMYGYMVKYERNDNWYGTKTSSQHYGFQKIWPSSWSINFLTYGGYNMLSAEGYTNYFDLRVGASINLSGLNYELVFNYANNSDQFEGSADPSVTFGLQAQF